MLIISIICNIGILSIFKYFNFFLENINFLISKLDFQYALPFLSIILPLGLSFHVFQSMSYTIEVYRKRQKAEKNLGIYALYVLFFPQLVAGPIERPYNLLHQFRQRHNFNEALIVSGLKLMLWGFFKKVVIADRLGIFVDSIYSNPTQSSGLLLALATYSFAFQIYCDFSGYSDIAIGAARVMGFKLMTNFEKPYLSKSISEFWTRWHISLSSWFRDYLYIPLGGNRVNKIFWVRNILFVFLISGFWHGADWKFVIWGGLHGFYLLLERLLNVFWKKYSFLIQIPSTIKNSTAIFITFNLVSFSWIFFRANNIKDAWLICEKIIFSIVTGNTNLVKANIGLSILDNDLIITFLFVFILVTVEFIQKQRPVWELLKSKPIALRWLVYYIVLFIILFFGEFNRTKFIYFQF